MTTAIAGTRRAFKELSDGTIRVQIDIDPKFTKDFLELFSAIDMPVALAPLEPAFEQQKPVEEPTQAAHTAAIGPLCQLACIWCKDRDFKAFAGSKWMKDGLGAPLTEAECKAEILKECGVTTRKDLDVIPAARDRFKRLRLEFMAYQGQEE